VYPIGAQDSVRSINIHRDSSQLPVAGAIGHDGVDTATLLAAGVGRNVGPLQPPTLVGASLLAFQRAHGGGPLRHRQAGHRGDGLSRP
jgi:hypothetical protein